MTNSLSQKDAPVFQTHHLDALDGLRGIAIALVVWYHLWQVSWLDPHIDLGSMHLPLVFIPISGFLGVEMFFFLSAFVLSYPYVRAQLSGDRPPSTRHFAYRRFIKIVPSYVLSLIAVMVLAALPGAKESWGANIDWTTPGAALLDFSAHLAFIHTFFYDTYASINGVLWTLGIEVQYYVIFPMLITMFLRAPFAIAAIMAIIAIAYRIHIGECCQMPIFDHNLGQLLGFFDYFAAGMLAAYAYGLLRARRPHITEMRGFWTLVAVAGFVWIGFLFWNLTAHRWDEEFASWWLIRNGTYYAVAIFLAGIGSLFAAPGWLRLLANPLFLFLAVISYNLYLWHQVVFRWVATWPFIPHAPGVTRGDPTFAWITSICGLALALAVATFVTYAVERPLLRMDPEVLLRITRPQWVAKIKLSR